MVRTRSIALLCLVWLITGLYDHALAVRTPQQKREQANPYLILPPGSSSSYEDGTISKDLGPREFTLRHIYHRGSYKYPDLHLYRDISSDAPLRVTSDDGETYENAPTSLRARAASLVVERLAKRTRADIDRLMAYSEIHGQADSLPSSAWRRDEVAGPNVTDKETILSFARMAANAYVQEHNAGEWQPVGGGFNYTEHFGWENDGLRGHIFADKENGTVVIGLKGTSPAVFDGSDTTGNDKLNDNLFGSCCCGQGGQYLWKQVCDCMTSTYTCNSTCLVKSLRQKSHYYWAVRDLYHNVTERYPDADIWLAGHSLGGVVSGLLGLTYGLPTITFEAFPDALAASRLGLPTPPGYRIGSHQARSNLGIYHVGHTADPIYMGTCNAASSFCTIAGYAFQGSCHTGQTSTYDTVGDLGWRVGIGTHKIVSVIKDVLEKYDHVPAFEEDTECQDCFNWKFFESNSSVTTSSSTSSSTTRTRTETCKTPGWWGCLDETSTSKITSTTSSSSTSTCRTPGWFGCKDPTTTTTTSKPASTPKPAPGPTITTTSSTKTECATPGWFGCLDPTSATIATPRPSPVVSHPTPVPTTSKPSSSNLPTTRRKCVARHWYGLCKQWNSGPSEVKTDL